jgi:radical SAM/Cys-rich protein
VTRSILRPVTSLNQRRSPLADPQQQLARLRAIAPPQGDFAATLAAQGWPSLQPAALEILQLNLGKLCNMACRHCHVDAGPDRKEVMTRETATACLAVLDQTSAHTVDLTGGAPELNPQFRWLVTEAVKRGKQVIDRCNLSVLLLPGMEDLPHWLAAMGVEVVCSLPHYRQRNTDAQRGDGTFESSIEALKRLNAAGYGQGDPKRRLTLMSNPTGAYLAKQSKATEAEWKAGLWEQHRIQFDRLIALNNMPIARFLEWLETSGNLQSYFEVLAQQFNPATIAGLMCRNTLSVGWDGQLYDCDFNQMLELPICLPDGSPMNVFNFDLTVLQQRSIVTAHHCFGCTAGAGSSCGGATASGGR